jgi:hypothetical protein
LPPTDRIVFSAQKREPPKGLTRTRRQPQIRPPRCQPQIRPPPAATTAPTTLRLRCSPPFPARSHCPCLIPGLPDRARQAWNQSEPSSRQAAGGWRKRQAREQQKGGRHKRQACGRACARAFARCVLFLGEIHVLSLAPISNFFYIVIFTCLDETN